MLISGCKNLKIIVIVKGLLRFADVEPGEHDYAGAAKLSKPGGELNDCRLKADRLGGSVKVT